MITQNGQKLKGELSADSSVPVDAPQSSLLASVDACSPQPAIYAEVGRYQVRLARNVEERDAACRLRFRVFNIELGEGLQRSYLTGMDTDEFDLFCDHLIVEDQLEPNLARRIVGTYRMQSGLTALKNLGYYSEQEFFFEPYESLRMGVLELGRASIAQDHRTPEVLTLLWRGIAQYACEMGLRYLIGCSSLNSQEPTEGWQLFDQLQKYRVSDDMQTRPKPGYLCPERTPPAEKLESEGTPTKIPKLLRTYLTIGARICAPPAWDREFGTIDFLTLLDLKLLTASARNHFLMPSVH